MRVPSSTTPPRAVRQTLTVSSASSRGARRRNLQTKNEQHRLIPHLAKLRRHRIDVESIAVEPRLDCNELLAAHLECHRRCIDAASDVEMPKLIQSGVIVGRHRSVSEARYEE